MRRYLNVWFDRAGGGQDRFRFRLVLVDRPVVYDPDMIDAIITQINDRLDGSIPTALQADTHYEVVLEEGE